MNLIVNNAKWVMLVSGILTATMFYGLFAPQAALESMFGVIIFGFIISLTSIFLLLFTINNKFG